MQKPDIFRQANPKDQLTAILSGLEGSLSNVEDGIAVQKSCKDMQFSIELIKLLGNWLPLTWEN